MENVILFNTVTRRSDQSSRALRVDYISIDCGKELLSAQ